MPQVMMQGNKKHSSHQSLQERKRHELFLSTSNNTIVETIKRCCAPVAAIRMEPQQFACASFYISLGSHSAFACSKKSRAVGHTLDLRRVEEPATEICRLQVILRGDEQHLTILVIVLCVPSVRGASVVLRLAAVAVSLQERSEGGREVIMGRIEQVSAHERRLTVARYSPRLAAAAALLYTASPMLPPAARQGGRLFRAAAGHVCLRQSMQWAAFLLAAQRFELLHRPLPFLASQRAQQYAKFAGTDGPP